MPRRGTVVPQGRSTCESCRERKVRCNRTTPCSQCSRLQLPCIYETRKRRPPLKPPSHSSPQPPVHRNPSPQSLATNQDVLARLGKVEELLSDLRGSLHSGPSPNDSVERNQTASTPVLVPPLQPSREPPEIGGARGNYVDNSVFVSLFLEGSSSQASPKNAPPDDSSITSTHRPVAHYGIVASDVFGPQVDVIHIPSEAYARLWDIYIQNFDPLVKLLHTPTMQPLILNASANPQWADAATMALVYAVSFAATATLTKSETMSQFNCDKSILLRHFMQQTDGALMRAQLILRPNAMILTAFVIYLTALRVHDASRCVWTLAGLAIRIAESLGVHQDGARLSLSPFDTEMRRRLWWHLASLDDTSPENIGLNSTFAYRERAFRLPTNVDDVDFSPKNERVTDKEAWTEMSFSIMNLESWHHLRYAITASNETDFDSKMVMIQEAERTMDRKWLRFADMSKPICRAADALLRISVQRAQFILTLQRWLSTNVGTDVKYCRLPRSVFITAVKLLENGYLLQSGKLFHNFAWFYQQHPLLYALFLVLRTLHVSPERPEADRAWVAVDNYFECLSDFEEADERKGRTSCVWTVLNPLRDKARESCHRAGPGGQGLLYAGLSSKTSTSDPKSGNQPQDSVSPLPTSGSDIHAPFPRADQFALEPSMFDNILAWQDFSDWFNMDTGLF